VLVVTDHSNLQFMDRSENQRVGRWKAAILEFSVSVIFAPGKTNFIADYMCRCLEQEPETRQAAVQAMIVTGRFKDYLEPEEEEEIRAAIEGMTASTGHNGESILAEKPTEHVIDLIFIAAHNSPIVGHAGRERTLRRVKGVVTWPSVNADIAKRCSACALCQKLRAREVRPAELAELPARAPHEAWITDSSGPWPNRKYVHAIMDRFSHAVQLFVAKNASAAEAAKNLMEAAKAWSTLPRMITSDGGSTFAGKFAEACRRLSIEQHITLPHHPEGHALVEREFRDMNAMIRAIRAQHKEEDFENYIGRIQIALGTAYSRALGTTPFEVLHGFPARTALANAVDHQGALSGRAGLGDAMDWAMDLAESEEEMRTLVEETRRKVHDENARRWRQRAQGKTDFKPGDYALVRRPTALKWDVQWQGPFVVRGPGDDANSIEIQDLDGDNRRTEAKANVHEFRPGTMSPEELEAEATKPGEYLVDKVHEHSIDGEEELWFFVDWTGYPASKRTDSDAWVALRDCHWSPKVKQYIARNNLKSMVARRIRSLGPLPTH